jgi:hypothetical protein
LLPFFLDAEEVAAGNLPAQVKEALHASRFLIVICSPRVRDPKKPWVEYETAEFLRSRPENIDRILPLLIEGEPDTAFPQCLCSVEGQPLGPAVGSQIASTLGANIAANNFRRSIKLLQQEKLRLLAPIIGIPFAELADREAARARKRRKLMLGMAVAVLVTSYVAFPPHDEQVRTEDLLRPGTWVTCLSGRAAVYLYKEAGGFLWQADRGWARRWNLPGTAQDAVISDSGRLVLLRTHENTISVIELSPTNDPQNLTTYNFSFAEPVEKSPLGDSTQAFAIISPDDRWIAALTGREVFLWHPGEAVDQARPYFRDNNPDHVGKLGVRFIAKGTHLLIYDLLTSSSQRGKMWVGNTGLRDRDPKLIQHETQGMITSTSSGAAFAFVSATDEIVHCKMNEEIETACANFLLPRRRSVRKEVAPPPIIQISEDDRWLLAKRYGGALFAMDLSDQTPTFKEVIPRVNLKSGFRTGSKILSCANHEWLATLSGDSEIFLWRAGDASSEKILPNGDGTPLMQFAPNCKTMAVTDAEGTIQLVNLGSQISTSAFSEGAPFGSFTQLWGIIRWAADSKSVYAFDQSQVFWGDIRKRMAQIATAKGEVRDIVLSGDRRTLLVLANGHLVQLARYRRFWGLNLGWNNWPEMDRLPGFLYGTDSLSGSGAGQAEDPD